MAESEDSGKAKYPELESRRSPELSYGEEDERAARERRRRHQDNRAFYLIEREAIYLRRLRWDHSPEGRRASEEVDYEATGLQQARHRVDRSATVKPTEPLAQYARPLERRAAQTPRFAARVRSWFGSTEDRRGKRRTKA